MRAALAAAALALAGIGTAQAQTVPAAAASAPVDPARLAAAQQLLAVMMPPEQRARMIETMVRPMMANIRQSIAQVPQFAETIGKDPKTAEAFQRFLKLQEDRTLETMQASMPGMMDAMARAYARRFDIGQIVDIRTFFATPSGKAYLAASYTIMTDPDVLAWQRDLMSRSMGHMQDDIGKFVAELSANSPEPPK